MPKNNSKARRDIRAGEAKTRNEESRARETDRLNTMYTHYIKTFPDEALDEVAEAFGIFEPEGWRYEILREAWARTHAPRRAQLF